MPKNRAEQMGIVVNLKSIRKDKGLTQEELSRLVLLNSSRISKIEAGIEVPSVVWGNRIARALNVTTFDIWKEKD